MTPKSESIPTIAPLGRCRTAKLVDIARLANVSVTTASRVLNKRKYFDRISETTMQKVQAAARELHYEPNRTAQNLVTNRTHTIGVFVHPEQNLIGAHHPIVGESFTGFILGYSEEFFRELGYDLLIINFSENARSLGHCSARFHNNQIDGVLGVGSCNVTDLNYLAEQGVPAVAVNYAGASPRASFVGLDNIAAIHLGVDHLVSLGHKDIAFLGGCNPVVEEEYTVRCNAFRERMAHHSLTSRFVWNGYNTVVIPRERDFQYHEGRWAAEQIANMREGPTALITVGDIQAFGFVQRMGELGLQCPEDVSVIGFDNSIWARISSPGLTSLDHAVDEMTRRACSLLLDHIECCYANTPWQVKHEMLCPQLVVRNSTASPGTIHE